MNWKRYMEDYDEGLGTVYERFMLDEFFEKLLKKYEIKKVLEAPIFGMVGVSGINSVYFARNGCDVTLIDDSSERIKKIEKVWKEIGDNVNVKYHKKMDKLPFKDDSFDLVWNFAAIDKVEDKENLIKEMFRVSNKFVLIFTPNNKLVFNLFKKMDEYKSLKKNFGDRLINEGIIDIPPWPDTKISIKRKMGKEESEKWRWSMVDYLKGNTEIKNKVMKLAFIEKLPLPWRLKLIWAHHRFLLFRK